MIGIRIRLNDQWFLGVRGSSSLGKYSISTNWSNAPIRREGMFPGKKISGVREVASAVANTREFARCVTINTLRGLYGRSETLEDLDMIDNATDRFMTDYNYNNLVKYLATQPHFYSVQ